MSVLRVVILFVLTLICFVDSGCVSREEGTRGDFSYPADELRFDCQAPFGSLTQLEQRKPGSLLVIPFLYSFLFVPSESGDLEPDLASTWTEEDGGKTWLIRIRPDAMFHDQTPVTTGDVMASLATGLKGTAPRVFALIADMRVESRDTLRITLLKANPRFPRLIWRVPVMPASGRGDPAFPVGSGPYRFSARDGEAMVELKSNDRYYGGKPSIGTLRFYHEPDQENSWARLLAGKTDVVQDIPPKDYRIMRKLGNRFHFSETVLTSCQVLLFNTTRPPFSDPRVRLAVSGAINRWSLVERVLGGAGVVGVGPMGVDSIYRNPLVESVAHTPARSVRLLEEAGWLPDATGRVLVRDGKPLEFTIRLFEGAELDRRVAEFIQLCLNDVGVLVKLEPLPANRLVQSYMGNTDFDAVLTEFITAGENPAPVARIWSQESGGMEALAGRFSNPEVNDLFSAALTESDPERKVFLYRRIDALMADLQPGAFLFHRMAFDAMSSRVILDSPFVLDLPGLWRLKTASLSKSGGGRFPSPNVPN